MHKGIDNKQDIMERKNALEKQLETGRPASWEQIPDIDLYKDQLTEYLKRQHIGFALGIEETLTSAMINNYIKMGVLPRAKGKRYDRDHIAYLTAVALLKQVLSVTETGDLLELSIEGGEDDSVKAFYTRYSDVLDNALMESASMLKTSNTYDEMKELALELAVRSYVDKLLARELISMLTDK